MLEKQLQLIGEAIKLGLNMAELYLSFQQAEHPTKGILQSLNEDDRSHADKIRSYMLQNGICVSDNE